MEILGEPRGGFQDVDKAVFDRSGQAMISAG
jgi:hypothetical protein